MATTAATAPYGSWRSHLTATSLTAETVDLSQPVVDGEDLYWLEGRSSDSGRVVLVRRGSDGVTADVTPAPFNVRSRVHEYGGGAYDVVNGVVVFCNFEDRRIYRMELKRPGRLRAPIPITPAGRLRYGDLRIDLLRRVVYAVCEDHGIDGSEPANRLVRLNLESDNAEGGVVLVEGHDFVSSPSPSPDGSLFAWLQWDHPNMPWDGTELCVADLAEDGTTSHARLVCGGPTESVTQPRWVADGLLAFISDRSGWWNLYACAVHPVPGEPFGLWPDSHEFAAGDWLLGTASYGISDGGTLLCSWIAEGYAKLATLDLATGARSQIDSEITAVRAVCVRGETALLIAGYADLPASVLRIGLRAPAEVAVVRRSSTETPDPGSLSSPEPVSWLNPGHEEVFGFYFAPRNARYVGPDDELPPLIVMSHGGPTGMSTPVYDPRVQYWTTRGFAVLEVNYGGSTGYGRAYRERLNGRWGIVDVDDCASGAEAMAAAGRADPARLAIRGGSAGGYTTLAALTFRDVFHAGASLFGIGDLAMLARDTHKFESRYLDRLIGPLPEAEHLYRERSPINHVDQIRCPMVLLQGRDDLVVPPNQAETMAAAVRAKGLPVALLIFEGEGHGFRKAENVIRAFEVEAYFYSRVFGFELGDRVVPIQIDNLP